MSSNDADSGLGCLLLVGIIGAVIFFTSKGEIEPGPSATEPKYSSDTYGSAMKKLDQRRSDQLTREEVQVVEDVVNWCRTCNKPARSCPHGK